MNFTDFLIPHEYSIFTWTNADHIVNMIQSDTSRNDFLKEMEKYPKYTLQTAGYDGNVALIRAANKGNLDLIDLIVEIGGKTILNVGNQQGEAPLHSAILCSDPEKGYLAVKKLIDLGSPVNIIQQSTHAVTPLESALNNGCIKIAILLLRFGGIARLKKLKDPQSLESARKKIMTQSEKLFKLGIFEKDALPNDVIRYILLISSRL